MMMRRILLSTRGPAFMSPIRRALSSPVSPADAASLQKMSARLTLENTYLSYTRNAVISTVAGGALVQYHKSQGRPPLAGSGLLLMGGIFMYSGSASEFHELEFRTDLKHGSSKEGTRQTGAKVVEGLQGEAYSVAETPGPGILRQADGVPQLITAIPP